MKKVILILSSILMITFLVQAQDNTTYLTKAFELLLEGNVSSAEKHYTVYKKLSGKTDADFEALLNEKKNTENEDWKKECYILEFNTGKRLAVYKRWSSLLYTYESASDLVSSSRLLGFNDWELPDKDEMALIISLIGTKLPYGNYWTKEYFSLIDEEIKQHARNLYKRNVLIVNGYYVLQHTYKSSTFYRELLERDYYFKEREYYEPQNRFILVREF